MPDENIKYKSDVTKTTITALRDVIQSGLMDKKTKYDNILNDFSVSECMQATSFRGMINKEKEIVGVIAEFYPQMLSMLENASNDIDSTEHTYSEEAGTLFSFWNGQNR
ncbi:MAG: hypothetical protein Q4D94_10635 [Bacillota bacterium]|nr:hypothetical protein [Bacillota bacterium]